MEPTGEHTADTVLRVEGLGVTVGRDRRIAVRGVDFQISRGESVGLVGESGSGKTLTCRSVLGLLPPGCAIDGGRITLGSGPSAVELTGARRKAWDQVRGARLGAVFQDPASYLNPSLTVGHQLAEQLRVKRGTSRREARERSIELFAEVGLRHPAEVFHQYPHQLSGGMLQRVLIAIAVALEPELLIADEATTALDVVIQAEILELLSRLRRTHQLSLLLVTHDLAVVAETCDRILVMYGGEIVESGPTAEVLASPNHPYTRALLGVASIGNWQRRTLDVIPGAPPEAGTAMPGCRFAPRCADAGSPRAAPMPSPPAPRDPSPSGRPIRGGPPAACGSASSWRPAHDRPARGLRPDRHLRAATTQGLPRDGCGPVGCRPRDRLRGDRRHRRRDRLRQDHPRAGRGRAGAAGRGTDRLRGHRPGRAARPRAAGVPAHRADPARLPGPAALPRRRPQRRRGGRRAPCRRRCAPGRTGHPGAGVPGPGRAGGRVVPRALPAPALRRAAPARLARPGHRDPAPAAVLRRAGQRSRRVQPQPRPATAGPAAQRARPGRRDHRPRPELAGGHRRPGRGLLPRAAGGAGTDHRGPRAPGPPLHGAARRVGAQRAG
ncbi:Oligopeptide ABC transporter (ATP-binding protein) (modular protein) [metagenome]|uniref:Oligopeptide ABC transporter (ATP-binding protein) (Modular protein) n=1 Tax=metagenome TaxID=256318 RepID=A0A2P2CFM4_9ZZZZ